MNAQTSKNKLREWLRRYLIAEFFGTLIALAGAWITFTHVHSYIAAAGAGFVGEGIGFYGYFVVTELWQNGHRYKGLPFLKRLSLIFARSSVNLIVEFAPAEALDSIFIRPFAMFFVPQHIKPYALGFVVGKFSADLMFYIFAIIGYETKNRWLYRQ